MLTGLLPELESQLQRDLFNEFLMVIARGGKADELRQIGHRVLALGDVVQSIKAAAGELTSA